MILAIWYGLYLGLPLEPPNRDLDFVERYSEAFLLVQ